MNQIFKPVCPKCRGFSKVYYCSECIQQGNFVHSSVKHPERYADKKLRLNQEHLRQLTIGAKAMSDPPPFLKLDILRREVELQKAKNLYIRETIKETKAKKKVNDKTIRTLKDEIRSFKSINKKYQEKNKGLQENVILYNSRLPGKKELMENLEKKRKDYVKKVVKELFTDIFTFHETEPESSEEEYENQAIRDMVQSIDDATHTHYVRGRWVTVPTVLHERNFVIISTILPGSGDYATFARTQSGDETCFRKKVEDMLAGISYLCQTVNIVATILNVPLPKLVLFRDFNNLSGGDIEGKKFQKLNARLNTNVLFLCVSQGVSPASLHPLKPLNNMMALLNESNVDLGRYGSFEFPQCIEDIVDEIDEREDIRDSDTDSEWETINSATLPEIPAITPPRRRISYDETASSIVTSAASSVLSIFGIGNN